MESIRTTPRMPIWALAAGLLAGAVAPGCGGDDDEKSASGNPTDRAFAGAMVPHHESAVEMAELAKEKAEHHQLESLAHDIVIGQTAEIRTLRRAERHLRQGGVERGDLGLDEHMMGMDHDVHDLESAKAFDRAFIDMMVPHHQGAIRMARIELRRGDDRGLRRLAGSIVATQKREIRQMRRWRRAWYGSGDRSAAPAHSESGGHMTDH